MSRLAILRLLETYFRHRWLNLVPILIMGIAACGWYVATGQRYTSVGVLFVERQSFLASLTSVRGTDVSGWNTPAQDTANEFDDILRTDSYIWAIINETDLKSQIGAGTVDVNKLVLDVRKNLWASVLGPNQISVSASDKNPEIARQLATTAIQKFIQWKINSDRMSTSTAEDFFANLIKDHQERVASAQEALRNYLQEHPEPVRGSRSELEALDIENLRAALQFEGNQLAAAMQKAEDAQLASSQVEADIRQTYYMMDAPLTPTKPAVSKLKLAMNMGIFVVVGLIISLVAVIGGTVFDLSLRFPAEVSYHFSLPVLAVVPNADGKKKRPEWKWFRKKSPLKAEQEKPGISEESEAAAKPDEGPQFVIPPGPMPLDEDLRPVAAHPLEEEKLLHPAKTGPAADLPGGSFPAAEIDDIWHAEVIVNQPGKARHR